ncbi:MAG: hypothetical protein LBH15_00880 [Treponema sp.]|jgi:hypothetical protein|nr:hypothetical protein [Treponema sp.]
MKYDPKTGAMRGKLGAIVFETRKGAVYARKHVDRNKSRTPAQLAHRALYGQLQGLGSIWQSAFIRPYFSGDTGTQNPYNRFIAHNWAQWDKATPAWLCAVPFWGYGTPGPFSLDAAPGPDALGLSMYPPPGYGVSTCTPRLYIIHALTFQWEEISLFRYADDHHYFQFPGRAAYQGREISLLFWHNDIHDSRPVADCQRSYSQ